MGKALHYSLYLSHLFVYIYLFYHIYLSLFSLKDTEVFNSKNYNNRVVANDELSPNLASVNK